jgi:iron complex outermembrane receptor protein
MNRRALIVGVLATPALAAELPSSGEIDTVVVTGSRIRGTAEEHTAPVTFISRQELARGGNDSLGRALQSLPYNTGSAGNTNVNNGGDGATRLDLRGLTPKRTLVLLNGRRLPNGGVGADSSVDIDSLPLSMVERVEVLTTGASAVYGADAIGGVVNVITRTDVDGATVGAQLSQAERGDGAIGRAQLLLGMQASRGHWSFGLDVVDQQAVYMDARDYSAAQFLVADETGGRVEFGSIGIPDGRFFVTPGNGLGLAPGIYTRVAGAAGQTASDWRLLTPADTFNFAPYNLLQTPNERATLWMTGTHALNDDIELFVEGVAARRESAQILAPASYMLIAGNAPTAPGGMPQIPANNYYNPFAVPVPRGQRRLTELGNRGYEQRVDSWRALSGARGRFREWNWEISVARAESDAVTHEVDVPLSERFVAGLGPSGPDALGNIVCGVPESGTGVVPAAAIIAGCVPINLFGGAGSITQEQLDFMAVRLRDPGSNSQTLAGFTMDGNWGRSWTGELRWAVGIEYRREAGGYEYDLVRTGGTVGAGLAADTPHASFEAAEAFAEVRIPLALTLDSTLGARVSDFSSFGTHTTAHAGLRWQLADAWTLRADFTQLFRAPSLAELHERRIERDGNATLDPCGRDPTPAQRVNCEANGVPGGSYVQGDADIHLISAGGNPELEPEQGHSLNVGVEWKAARERLNLSADYFQTRLDDFISSRDPALILEECANRDSTVACDNIERFEDGSLNSVDTRQSNFGRVAVTGIDLAAQLRVATRAGDIGARLVATHLLEHDSQTFEGGTTISNAGRANVGMVLPRWRASGSVDWTRGAWRLGYVGQFIGAGDSCSVALNDAPYCARTGSVLYHDLEFAYRWYDLDLRAGVNNLSAREPPFLNGGAANTDPATYRLLGRSWFLQLEYALE